jgi:hypothetical protein
MIGNAGAPLPIHIRAVGRYHYPRREDDHDHFRWDS